jgi:hypothetical protein
MMKNKTLSDEIEENRDFQGAHLNYKFIDVKYVKKYLQEFKKELKDIEIWNCSPDEYLDKVNQLYVKHFGEKLI